MTDLFEPEGLAEMLAEREAIARHDGGLSPAEAAKQARTDTETWRHQCEVRYVLRKRASEGRSGVDRYLGITERVSGPLRASKLREDAAAQWALGNRGEPGDWRVEPGQGQGNQ